VSCDGRAVCSARAFWIYRDGREQRRGADVRAELLGLVSAVGAAARASDANDANDAVRPLAVEALVACGELESALADGDVPASRAAITLARETDRLAATTLGAPYDVEAALRSVASLLVPELVTVSVQEGFAFYALHPEAYAHACAPFARPESGRGVLVVGIRSIGTTLSAIACAALARRGENASRITVRPGGSPHDRSLAFDDAQHLAVLDARARRADVLVVDEGPGISGSTFLATAEALARAGIAPERITLVCSHEPDRARLAARDAVARLRPFHVVVVPADVRVPCAVVDLSAGAWRSRAYAARGGEHAWPASFIQTERRKLLLADGRLAKFEGLGRAGRSAAARAASLAAAGFAPAPRDEGEGWISYEWAGAPLAREDLDMSVIERIAELCARRTELCPATSPSSSLEAMVAKNLALGVGRSDAPALPIERLAVVDGRMAPHEWLRASDGRLLKSDGISHGDDHFFPGPTDIAWDLAGAIVEWQLDESWRAQLLSAYERRSGDDARARIDAWTLAYVAFRLAFTSAGMSAAQDAAEAARLARDVARHHASAKAVCPRGGPSLEAAEPG
jgi:hypothetical protein